MNDWCEECRAWVDPEGFCNCGKPEDPQGDYINQEVQSIRQEEVA